MSGVVKKTYDVIAPQELICQLFYGYIATLET
jgi:hypothetical protein